MAGELIMVVDDDESIRSALSEFLSDEGYRVVTVAGGREALACLSDGRLPHLILLDLMMPEMDGWKFRAEQMVNPALAAIPVIIITAVAHPEQTATLGVAVFRKPLDTAALLAAIQKHCPHTARAIEPEQSAPSLAPSE